MQSLRADQSSYNRKGVCYIFVFSVYCRCQEYEIFLFQIAKIDIFLEKIKSD